MAKLPMDADIQCEVVDKPDRRLEAFEARLATLERRIKEMPKTVRLSLIEDAARGDRN